MEFTIWKPSWRRLYGSSYRWGNKQRGHMTCPKHRELEEKLESNSSLPVSILLPFPVYQAARGAEKQPGTWVVKQLPPVSLFFISQKDSRTSVHPWKQRLSFWWLLCKESPCEALVGDSSIHTLNHATEIMRVKMGWHICIWVPGILPSGPKKISNLKNFFWHFIITYLTHPKIYKESQNE